MPTTTETQKILIKKNTELTAENGYDLVVMEDNGFRVYEEGNLPTKKGWNPFQKSKITEVYAVSNDRKHEISTKKTVLHSSGIHDFFVNVSILYGVSDPTEVVRKLRRDPVERLIEQAGKVVAGFLKVASWEEIKNPARFNRLRAVALEDLVASGRNDAVALFDKVADHGRNFGLELFELNFDVVLDEEALEVVMAEYKAQKAKEKSDINTDREEHEKQNQHKLNVEDKYRDGELKDLDRIEMLKDVKAETMGASIRTVGENVSGNIRDISDASRVLDELKRMQLGIGAGAPEGDLGLGSGSNSRLLGSGQNLVSSLYELLEAIQREQLNIVSQKKVLGVIFSMVGSKLLDEESEKTLSYLDQLRGVEMSPHLNMLLKEKIEEAGKRIDNNLLF